VPNVSLTTRFGRGVRNPSDADLEAALTELYVENHPSLIAADYEEHPNAWLEYGYEDGDRWTVHTLDIYRTGVVIFSKLEDQDDDEAVFEKQMNGVDRHSASRLWRTLARGDIEELEKERWA
jgi:hypothetical protein